MAVRRGVGREANERLRAVMEEAGCSATGLARRVNGCGAEHGIELHYDKTSVARWLRGQQPRGRAPAVIAEALGRKLGRVVTVDEIGMSAGPGPNSAIGLRFEPTVPGALQQARVLWLSDATRTGPPAGEKLATSVLVQASRDWMIAQPDSAATGDGHVAVCPEDIAAVRAATAAFADLDHRFGSGHVRPVVIGYLSSVVSELLAGSYGDSTGRRLLGAAARLTELAGYMSVDTGRLGLAQRHYIQALRLAQAADDRGLGGYILASGMSHVALVLGNPRETIQLARVAWEGTRGKSPATARAVFHVAEARGHALLGDARTCERAIAQALGAWERHGQEEVPSWLAHVDQGHLAEEAARCYLDLKQHATATRWARDALQGCPPDRVRRRALRLLLLARGQLRLGEAEQSRSTAAQAVEALRGVRSAQCADSLDALRALLDPAAGPERRP